MAAPTPVNTVQSMNVSVANATWTLTLGNGFTAGNTIVVGINQQNSSIRTINSISDGTGNTYTAGVNQTSGTAQGGVFIWYAAQIANSVSGGASFTVNFSSTATGDLYVLEITAATYANITDVNPENTSTTSHISGATGITTGADAFVVTMACASGSLGTTTKGTAYDAKATGPSALSFFQYVSATAGLTGDQGAWSSTTSRATDALMATFTTAGGGPPPSTLSTLSMMGVGS